MGGLRYAYPDPSWLWAGILAAGLAYLVLRKPPAEVVVWRSCVALAVTSAVLYPLTLESRLLPPITVAGAVGFALLLNWLWAQRSHRLAAPALGLALAALLAVIHVSDERADIAFGFFAVVDQPMLHTAEWLSGESDVTVAVREDARGWPIGWWFRGLVDEEFLVGSNPRWLGFEVEIEQAAFVEYLFSTRDPVAVRALAAERDVDLLVARKWEWIGWQHWIDDPAPLPVAYDDGTFIVFDVNAPD